MQSTKLHHLRTRIRYCSVSKHRSPSARPPLPPPPLSPSMAQGRGNAYPAAFILITVGLQWHLASAVTYTVGGSKGWDLGVDYTSWAGGLTFKAGDILFFPYVEGQHNVVVVNKAGYDACSAANAASTFTEGNTNVSLSTTGAHYYLCSVDGHCPGGMKLAVNVSSSGTATSPTASHPATAPTPSKTPSSPPIHAPAPSSSSTPSSAPAPSSPAPAPTPEAPGSAPTPSSPALTPTVGTPASGPAAPGSTPSTPAGTTPTSSPPPPNAAHSLLASTASMALLVLWAALFI